MRREARGAAPEVAGGSPARQIPRPAWVVTPGTGQGNAGPSGGKVDTVALEAAAGSTSVRVQVPPGPLLHTNYSMDLPSSQVANSCLGKVRN